jgi:hypothetical protein
MMVGRRLPAIGDEPRIGHEVADFSVQADLVVHPYAGKSAARLDRPAKLADFSRAVQSIGREHLYAEALKARREAFKPCCHGLGLDEVCQFGDAVIIRLVALGESLIRVGEASGSDGEDTGELGMGDGERLGSGDHVGDERG